MTVHWNSFTWCKCHFIDGERIRAVLRLYFPGEVSTCNIELFTFSTTNLANTFDAWDGLQNIIHKTLLLDNTRSGTNAPFQLKGTKCLPATLHRDGQKLAWKSQSEWSDRTGNAKLRYLPQTRVRSHCAISEPLDLGDATILWQCLGRARAKGNWMRENSLSGLVFRVHLGSNK